MGIDRRLSAWLGVAAALGCRESAPVESGPAPPVAPVAVASAPPVDHLAKGELLEGTEKAFTLPLPRDAKVESRFGKSVSASMLESPEDVSNYIRARVRDGSVTSGASATLFVGVRVPSASAVRLDIDVRKHERGLGTSVEVRDSTTEPAPNLPDEASRWKAAGLTPDGKPLDPKTMQ